MDPPAGGGGEIQENESRRDAWVWGAIYKVKNRDQGRFESAPAGQLRDTRGQEPTTTNNTLPHETQPNLLRRLRSFVVLCCRVLFVLDC